MSSSFLHSVLFSFFLFCFFFVSSCSSSAKEGETHRAAVLCGPQAEWFASWITLSSFSLRSRIPAGKRGGSFFFFFLSLNETKVWSSVAYSFFPLSSVYIRLR